MFQGAALDRTWRNSIQDLYSKECYAQERKSPRPVDKAGLVGAAQVRTQAPAVFVKTSLIA